MFPENRLFGKDEELQGEPALCLATVTMVMLLP